MKYLRTNKSLNRHVSWQKNKHKSDKQNKAQACFSSYVPDSHIYYILKTFLPVAPDYRAGPAPSQEGGGHIRNSDARLALWSVNKTIFLPVEGRFTLGFVFGGGDWALRCSQGLEILMYVWARRSTRLWEGKPTEETSTPKDILFFCLCKQTVFLVNWGVRLGGGFNPISLPWIFGCTIYLEPKDAEESVVGHHTRHFCCCSVKLW